jgi:hypothetical protein
MTMQYRGLSYLVARGDHEATVGPRAVRRACRRRIAPGSASPRSEQNRSRASRPGPVSTHMDLNASSVESGPSRANVAAHQSASRSRAPRVPRMETLGQFQKTLFTTMMAILPGVTGPSATTTSGLVPDTTFGCYSLTSCICYRSEKTARLDLTCPSAISNRFSAVLAMGALQNPTQSPNIVVWNPSREVVRAVWKTHTSVSTPATKIGVPGDRACRRRGFRKASKCGFSISSFRRKIASKGSTTRLPQWFRGQG